MSASSPRVSNASKSASSARRASTPERRPTFLESTRSVREADWTVAPIPPDLRDRRVEITGPTDRKMVINALNSGASVFMADFEDSNSPTWENCIEGQQNLSDAIRRTIDYTSPEGKPYKLNPKVAVLFVRPRGWHLNEKHLTVNGTPMSASLFDFGLFFFHNAKEQIARGTGPYFYLPKMEKPRRSASVERRLRLRPGVLRRPQGNHSRHGAHRNHHRGLRNGRDSVRAARPFRRSQLRTLGLHLQLHQEIP